MSPRRTISDRIAADGLGVLGAGHRVRAALGAVEGSGGDFRTGKPILLTTGIPAVQVLVIDDFPDPALARTLSPNGRTHWRTRQGAKKLVRDAVWAAWVVRQDEYHPVPPPAHVTYRWIVPNRQARDLDNHGTGVVKVVQDTLVQLLKLLPGGDHSTVLTSRVEIVYEKGARRMEILLEHDDRSPAATDARQAVEE